MNPKTLQWSTREPDQPGWWLCANKNGMALIFVSHVQGQLVVIESNQLRTSILVTKDDGLWSGPYDNPLAK